MPIHTCFELPFTDCFFGCVAAEAGQWDAAPPAEAANAGDWAQAADPSATAGDWAAADAPASTPAPAENNKQDGEWNAAEAPAAPAGGGGGDWGADQGKDFGANY